MAAIDSLPSTQAPLGFRWLPRRLHYGWWITIGVAVLMFATVGVGYYGLAVFLRPLQEENGWSNTVVSGATGPALIPVLGAHGRAQLASGALLTLGLALGA